MTTLILSVLCAGIVALIASTSAGFAQAVNDRARLAEARVVIAIELVAEKKLGPCQIDGEAWMAYPVPADIARKYLGAHGGVTPGPPPASPRATLDPGGARAEIFCSNAENRARRDAANAALQPGERISRVTLGYTFPVFDAAGRTAIVIVEHDVGTWRRDDDGSRVRSSGETFGVAHIYRKRGKRWKLIATEEVYSALY